jgi:hypothetical protein
LTREWAEGHSLTGRAHRKDERFVGVELFQLESYDPSRCRSHPADPIQLALGILSGQVAPAAAAPGSSPDPIAPASSAKATAVAAI